MIHFFNPFPDLLTYGILAPLFLRLALGYFFINVAIFRFNTIILKKESLKAPTGWKILAVAEIILAICFILGFGVQIDAIISVILLGLGLNFYKNTTFLQKYPKEVLWLLLLISLSLLLSGAGLPAIDLPL